MALISDRMTKPASPPPVWQRYPKDNCWKTEIMELIGRSNGGSLVFRGRKILPGYSASSTAWTFSARLRTVKGLLMKWTPGSSTPWRAITLSVYPDMNKTFIRG